MRVWLTIEGHQLLELTEDVLLSTAHLTGQPAAPQ